MTNQLIAAIATTLSIAAALGVVLYFVAKLVFWSLEERPAEGEKDKS